jgi:hypothetical protein
MVYVIGPLHCIIFNALTAPIISMNPADAAKILTGDLIFKSIRYIFRRVFVNKITLLVPGLLGIVLLFVLHSTVDSVISSESAMQNFIITMTIVLLFLVEMSVVWAGVIPTSISILGLVLVFTGIAFPFYGLNISHEGNFKGVKVLVTNESISQAANAYFFLGVSMLCLSMVIAFRPRLLYTKNRPESIDSIWNSYQLWDHKHKNGGEDIDSYLNNNYASQSVEPVMPIKDLMNEKEKYLLWRYEYVLTMIHNRHYLVGIQSVVPISSIILRDNTGRMMGKPKYTGFFV